MHTTGTPARPLSDAVADAVAVHREDGEVLGFVRSDGDRWVPCTVFGYALGSAVPRHEAVERLHTEGLSCLADAWELRTGGEWLSVRIIEANPQCVTVSYADYGRADLFGEQRRVDAPVGDALRRR